VSRAPLVLVVAFDFLVFLAALSDTQTEANPRCGGASVPEASWSETGGEPGPQGDRRCVAQRREPANVRPPFPTGRPSASEAVAIDQDASLFPEDFGHVVQIADDLG
jgi:hypothetical protein